MCKTAVYIFQARNIEKAGAIGGIVIGKYTEIDLFMMFDFNEYKHMEIKMICKTRMLFSHRSTLGNLRLFFWPKWLLIYVKKSLF